MHHDPFSTLRVVTRIAAVAGWVFAARLALGEGFTDAAGDRWTRFRGPNGTGVSHATTIPSEFGDETFNWKIALPGVGHSQPVVWDDRIFVTSAPQDGSTRFVTCLGVKDGSRRWHRAIESRAYHHHEWSSYASSTPALDASRVYCVFQHGRRARLHAYDHDGAPQWTHDLGVFATQHGFGGSPIVHEDTVVFPVHQLRGDPRETANFVVALDAATGDVRWKTPRPSRRAAYGTPAVFTTPSGDDELVFTSGGAGFYALDPSTGAPIWNADVFDLRTVSSPVFAAGLLFGTCGSGGGGNYLVALRPGGRGDLGETHVLYTLRRAVPYVPTALGVGRTLYLWTDKGGIVSKIDAATGQVEWEGRAGGHYTGSPVWIDGRPLRHEPSRRSRRRRHRRSIRSPRPQSTRRGDPQHAGRRRRGAVPPNDRALDLGRRK